MALPEQCRSPAGHGWRGPPSGQHTPQRRSSAIPAARRGPPILPRPAKKPPSPVDPPACRSTSSGGGPERAVIAQNNAEAERLFNALAEGGSVQMPLGPTFWAASFGMFTDRFGVAWMVNCEQDR